MKRSGNKTWRKALVWTTLGLLLAGLGVAAYFKKRDVVLTVQTERATRRNLTEVVLANGRIQPVLQVVINPEVSGEIVDLPVKEGQVVEKGTLLLRIKPDNYIASTNQTHAAYQSALAARELARANLEKARLEFARHEKLLADKLISESVYLEVKTAYEIAKASDRSSQHQADQAKASLERALDDLSKTTIRSPIAGTITKLKSQRGERVVGTALMAGTEIMTIANLDDMEARVDVGEVDVVLIEPGKFARLEVDAFRDTKFTGRVTEIANSSKTAGAAPGATQEATKFEVKIRIHEKAAFRPGMSVTAEIETRSRTNVVSVPIQCVTTRPPKPPPGATNQAGSVGPTAGTNAPAGIADPTGRRAADAPRAIEVVFVRTGDRVKMTPVKRGIADDTYVEIVEGLKEGDEVVTGSFRAINRDLEDGHKIKVGPPPGEGDKGRTGL